MRQNHTTEIFNEFTELQSRFIGTELDELERNFCRDSDTLQNLFRTRRNYTCLQVADIIKLSAALKTDSAKLRRTRFALIEANHRRSCAGSKLTLRSSELFALTGLRCSRSELRELVRQSRVNIPEEQMAAVYERYNLRPFAVRSIPRRIIRYMARKATKAETGVLLCLYLRHMKTGAERSRCSYRIIHELTGLSSRSISKAMQRLKELGLILKIKEGRKVTQWCGAQYCLVKPERALEKEPPDVTSHWKTVRGIRKKKEWGYKKQGLGASLSRYQDPSFFDSSSPEVKRLVHIPYFTKNRVVEVGRTARPVPTPPTPPPYLPPTHSPHTHFSPQKKTDKEIQEGRARALEHETEARRQRLLQQAERLKSSSVPEVPASKTWKPLEGDALEARKKLLEEQLRMMREKGL